MTRIVSTAAALALSVVLLPVAAEAHDIAVGGGFVHGFAHPFLGIDHVLAMVAVGLWAAQLGGRAFWLIPAAFTAVMGAAGVAGMAGIALPLVESGIAASVLVLGVLVVAGLRLSLPAGLFLVAALAVFHGHAHGSEMQQVFSPRAYASGFMAATALLHGLGLAAGLGAVLWARPQLIRVAGAATALAGLALTPGAF